MRKYEKPQMDIIGIEVKDIVTLSFTTGELGGKDGETFEE